MSIVLRNHRGYSVPFSFRRVPVTGPFEHLFDSLVDDYFAPAKSDAAPVTVAPRLNVTESATAYVVEAELPGVTKENVKIAVDGKLVTLEAEIKREVQAKEGETVVFAERTTEKFSRSFKLAAEVDDSRSVAKLENGILTLTLPKKEELRPKHIQVQ